MLQKYGMIDPIGTEEGPVDGWMALINTATN
jgi:hypothetical protein